jgi:hypothetical protein
LSFFLLPAQTDADTAKARINSKTVGCLCRMVVSERVPSYADYEPV